jgi:hypothetical protein
VTPTKPVALLSARNVAMETPWVLEASDHLRDSKVDSRSRTTKNTLSCERILTIVIVFPVESCRCGDTGFSLMNSVERNQIETPNRRIATTVSERELLSCLNLVSSLSLGRSDVATVIGSLFKASLGGISGVGACSTWVASVRADDWLESILWQLLLAGDE